MVPDHIGEKLFFSDLRQVDEGRGGGDRQTNSSSSAVMFEGGFRGRNLAPIFAEKDARLSRTAVRLLIVVSFPSVGKQRRR